MLAADNWCVKVHDRVYGPYSSEQLRKFAHEGRIASWSLIAPAGSRNWREARRENAFASFFGNAATPQAGDQSNAFGRRRDGDAPARDGARQMGSKQMGGKHGSAHGQATAHKPAAGAPVKQRPITPSATPSATAPSSTSGSGNGRIRKAVPTGAPKRARPVGQFTSDARRGEPEGPANFLIIFDVVSGAAGRIESAMHGLGPAFRLADNVWTVHCAMTTIGVRNAIAPYLRGTESLFVVDATHGRTSWQNYPPEAHSKITSAFLARGRNS